eukprot:TRINITY_DN1492_c0_g1_i2.p1 TRINITY_DN1492_c0_g1~~TRINITY_DN1492_c0_g1_i2.p1  ORF type:complete len:434 (-),score=79.80 TRINITY_DN1492_c0_g1_i2:50-1351(-)
MRCFLLVLFVWGALAVVDLDLGTSDADAIELLQKNVEAIQADEAQGVSIQPADIQKLIGTIDTLSARIKNELENARAELTKQDSQDTQRAQTLIASIQTLTEQAQAGQRQISGIRARLSELDTANKNIDNQISQMEVSKKSAAEPLAVALSSQIRILQQDKANKMEESARLRSSLLALENDSRDLTSRLTGLQQEADAAQQATQHLNERFRTHEQQRQRQLELLANLRKLLVDKLNPQPTTATGKPLKGMCAFARTPSCARGWKPMGWGGVISINSQAALNPFSNGAAFNADWKWVHPELCCAEEDFPDLGGNIFMLGQDNCQNRKSIVGALMPNTDINGGTPFYSGAAFNGQFSWRHPYMCQIDGDHQTITKHLEQKKKLCMLGTTCAGSFNKASGSALVLVRRDNKATFGSFVAQFNGDWNWASAKLCCFP